MRILDVFNIGHRTMFPSSQPYIIAEIGVNHEGKMDLAKRLIEEAKEGGADAVKFQSYKADTIAHPDSPSYWDLKEEPTTSQYELFQKYDRFGVVEYQELKSYCDKVNIEFLSTPFDINSVDYLNGLVDSYKVASADITCKPLIEHICSYKKPIILSTGASNFKEIEEAVSWIEAYDCQLALLHCVLNYPTRDSSAQLDRILKLQHHFPSIVIGYSDHTLPQDMKTLEIATLMGARILEKHFTHDKTLPGNDHYHAMDKEDLKKLRKSIARSISLIGQSTISSLEGEEQARFHARRSLVSAVDIPQDKVIEYEDLTWKRPASGISPKYIDQLIGRRACQLIPQDTILQWEQFEQN